jgi:hypothetical protein
MSGAVDARFSTADAHVAGPQLPKLPFQPWGEAMSRDSHLDMLSDLLLASTSPSPTEAATHTVVTPLDLYLLSSSMSPPPTTVATHDMLGWGNHGTPSVDDIEQELIRLAEGGADGDDDDEDDPSEDDYLLSMPTPSLSMAINTASMGHMGHSSPPLGDSGVDGDTDDSMSDVSSDVSSECGRGRGRRGTTAGRDSVFLPQLPPLERSGRTATSSRSSQQHNSTQDPRPRSGEALVASITPWERELLFSKFGVRPTPPSPHTPPATACAATRHHHNRAPPSSECAPTAQLVPTA